MIHQLPSIFKKPKAWQMNNQRFQQSNSQPHYNPRFQSPNNSGESQFSGGRRNSGPSQICGYKIDNADRFFRRYQNQYNPTVKYPQENMVNQSALSVFHNPNRGYSSAP